MIHTVVLPWPNQKLDADLGFKDVAGDTIIFDIAVDGVDLAEAKIRCLVTDNSIQINLANEAAGGEEGEIVFLESDSATTAFRIMVPAGQTTDFLKYGTVEVEVETDEGYIFTILQQKIVFIGQNIVAE